MGDESAGHEIENAAWKDDDFLSLGDAKPEANAGDISDADDSGTSRSSAAAAAATRPPWMDSRSAWKQNPRNPRRTAPLVSLHNEIVDFATLMEPRDYEIREREELVRRVTTLAEDTFGGKDRCTVKLFGSQATGLFLPSSDIDLVLLIPDAEDQEHRDQEGDENGGNVHSTGSVEESQKAREEREMKEWSASSHQTNKSPLVALGEALRQNWEDELSYLEVIEATRIPIVKFTHAPTNLSVDICLNQETGTKAADLVKRFGDAMPPLRPLTFVLKYFMAARGLNEPYSGGVGSFLLQMMIVSFLQHREREEFHSSGRESILNLGSLLLEFFELYGLDFNYITTGISVRNDGSYFAKGATNRREHFWQPNRPLSLSLENPFEPEMDVGKASFRMQLVQKSFEVAFRVLMSHVSEPAVPTVSILASILPPTDEMIFRGHSVLSKVDDGSTSTSPCVGKGRKPSVASNTVNSDMDMSSGEEEYERATKKKRRLGL